MTPTDFRREFVASFGIENANAILAAALEHKQDDNTGTDKLRWAILICIGHKCISEFQHGITCSWPAVREWLQARRDYIAAHDGDVDYLAMLTGAYDEILP